MVSWPLIHHDWSRSSDNQRIYNAEFRTYGMSREPLLLPHARKDPRNLDDTLFIKRIVDHIWQMKTLRSSRECWRVRTRNSIHLSDTGR